MIKMKKSAALILAGVLACSMPMPVMASSDTDVVESLLDSGIDFLASDPWKSCRHYYVCQGSCRPAEYYR